MTYVNAVDRWEDGEPTPIHPEAIKLSAQRARDVRPLLRDSVRRRLPSNQSTALRRWQICTDRVGISCIGPRAAVRPEGGGSDTHFVPEEKLGLGYHDELGFTINSIQWESRFRVKRLTC